MEFKLVDVPEMDYSTESDPPKGELCVRGESVFKEYFKDPQMTGETVDSEGWNHTGDVGVLLPNGSFRIVD